jgi:pimeloyl-ACP methyl ester carboxylesterase
MPGYRLAKSHRVILREDGQQDARLLNGLPAAQVKSSTLLIVGGYDEVVIRLYQEALAELRCDKELKIVHGATHFSEEPGTIQIHALEQ